jgi:hypothetical protein
MDSIANPHLKDDPGAIIAFSGETFELETASHLPTFHSGLNSENGPIDCPEGREDSIGHVVFFE